ncbi:ComEC/Rec2 family competence protein [Dongia sedimenti]|uniref:MBL fold metallo-hydrolase n=1 Tax=Dongia sedimenti TaxID=3064282 RepID=A0ABU0YTH5_9PROT|nr:MBL fold metallo-hydrolase [Rhodospirillaceae bacterium R-7]
MPEPNSLFVRFVDTGGGLATITVATGNSTNTREVMVFDAGHWNADNIMISELNHYVGQRHAIDVMVISHADSDHLGTADSILEYWRVKKAVRNGWIRENVNTFTTYIEHLEASVDQNGTEDHVMGDGSPAIGETWNLGDARLTFLSGFKELPEDWDVGVPPSNSRFTSKALNSASVVARLDYAGRSILFTGDAVGRLDGRPGDQLLATEKFLVENDDGDRRLRADILQAPHHGADNASSSPFIGAVQPEFVIFPAGHDHGHPKAATYQRFVDAGIDPEKMFRTDVGDPTDELEQPGEWQDDCTDRMGDDGISILIKSDGSIAIEQDPVANENDGC